MTHRAVQRATGHRRVLNRRLRTVQFLFVVIFGTVFAVGPTIEFLAGHVAATRLGIAGVAVVFAALAFRVLRLAVVLYRDQLVVRNVLRSYHVPRADIVGVDPAGRYGRLFKTGLLIRLEGGRTISASAFARTPVDSDSGAAYAKLIATWSATGIVPETSTPQHMLPRRRLRRPTAWDVWLALLSLLVAFAITMVLAAIIDPTSGG